MNNLQRLNRAGIYQQRLSFLAKILEEDPRRLELQLTRLAQINNERAQGSSVWTQLYLSLRSTA